MPLYNAQLHFQQALSESTTTVWLWCVQTLPKQSSSSRVVALLKNSNPIHSSSGSTPTKDGAHCCALSETKNMP